jgi:hypothetical protein
MGSTNIFTFRLQLILMLLILSIFGVVKGTLSLTSSSVASRYCSRSNFLLRKKERRRRCLNCRSTSDRITIPIIEEDSSSNDYYDEDEEDDSTTSTSLSTIPEDTIRTASSIWHVWKAADILEQSIVVNNNEEDDNDDDNNNTSSSSSSYYLYPAPKKLIRTVISILRTLGKQHDGKKEWQGILNKSTLLHEIEESILAIHFLQRELFLSTSSSSSSSSSSSEGMATSSTTQKEIIIVDACCGKGVFSLLCSYVFRRQRRQEKTISDDADDGYNYNYNVRKIIMLDNNADLKWDHVDATNEYNNNAAAAITNTNNNRPIIESWSRCNLHEIDTMVDRLSQEVQEVVKQQQSEEHDDEDESSLSLSLSTTTTSNDITSPILAVVGIHLCKTLSPTCIGIVNALGPTICPFLVLAPCCLPRSVIRQSKMKSNLSINSKKSSIEVRQYETPDERENRKIAKIRRDAAMLRGKGRGGEKKNGNIIRPVTRGDQATAILSHDNDDDDDSSSNANECCWKCGEYGHVKADCPSKQSTGKPQLILPPQLILDVSGVFLKTREEQRPFLSYCNLLKTSIQRSHVLLEETDLNNKHDDDTKNDSNKSKKHNKNQTNNWNNERKSVYIVART